MSLFKWFKFKISGDKELEILKGRAAKLAQEMAKQPISPKMKEVINKYHSNPAEYKKQFERIDAKPQKAKIKVAIDESIGAALARKIESRGYQIVTRAGHAETDDSWMKRALQSGALFIISPDLDIPSMIERENLPMVWIDFLFAGHVNPNLKADMPKELKHTIWSQYLHDRIQSKLKFLNKEFSSIP